MDSSNNNLLRYTLIANGVFSLLSALVLIFFENYVKRLFEADFIFLETGISLFLFSALVFYTAFRTPVDSTLVKIIIGMDIGWVIGSIIVLSLPLAISTTGTWLIVIVGFFVADFALFQYRGLQKVAT